MTKVSFLLAVATVLVIFTVSQFMEFNRKSNECNAIGGTYVQTSPFGPVGGDRYTCLEGR